MPLAGNFRQYALTDVLRAIESGQRTGRLTLSQGKLRAAIYFSGGQWLLAERIGSELPLAQRLTRVGLLAPEQFQMALGIPFAQAGAVPDVQLVRALLSARFLTQDQLRAFAVDDGVALLTVVLAWNDGDFAFEDGIPVPPGRVALPLPVAQLVGQAMQSARMNASGRNAPPLTLDAVIDFTDIEGNGDAMIQLTRDQWRILTAVDGQLPLWAVIQRLGAPEPVIMQLASELVSAGIVVVVGRVAQVGA
jgi:hypothetical protein